MRATTRRLLTAAGFVAGLVGAPLASLGFESMKEAGSFSPQRVTFLHDWLAFRAAESSLLASFEHADGWLNSPALRPSDLRGKIVLVDFWTYSCINWRRTLPHIRAWGEKYRDQGLAVIGVHTPEFSFEKDRGNIDRAVKAMRIDYPVAVDSDQAIWRAFGNRYWPALYLLDAQGRVRFHQFGEGAYGEAEAKIQELLRENGAVGVAGAPAAIDASGFEAEADWTNLDSPETYVGYDRAENVASYSEATYDASHHYSRPVRLARNQWSLFGNWTVRGEAAALNQGHGGAVYRFHARDLHLVMGPTAAGASVAFKVRIDGKPPGEAHGGDVDEQGSGAVTEQRLYQLVRQTPPIADREFEIEFLDPGVQLFDFTFG